MLKVFATDVVISKGYDGAPALKFSEKGDSVRFRIGKKVYDTRANNNYRWVNLAVKAFGTVCERIKKMQLKESSYVNIVGRLDEDVWEDPTTHEKRSAMVVILDEIEYCFSGGNKQKVVLARWIGKDSDLIILDSPTRGIDVKVKADIYAMMNRMRKSGKSIIMISEEIMELLGMADRILIMKDGKINGEFYRSEDLKDTDLIDNMI